MQAYSNPKRANDPHSLPNVEYFYHDGVNRSGEWNHPDYYGGEGAPEGWFWWPCFPGCLPDTDPIGPFSTKRECIADFSSRA